MINAIRYQLGLRRMLTLLLAAVLGITSLLGFAPAARAEEGAPTVHLTQGEGYSFTDVDGGALSTGDHPVEGSFQFRVAVEEGYFAKHVRVFANGHALKARSGVYTLEEVQGGIVVTVRGIKKQQAEQETHFTVTLPQNNEKYTITSASDPAAVLGGGDFTFTLTLNDAYSKTAPVVTDGTRTLAADKDGNAYTYTLSGVQENITITVDDNTWMLNKYALTLPVGDGYNVTNVTGGEKKQASVYEVQHGGALSFRIKTHMSYAHYELDVQANGKPLSPKKGVYTVENVKEDVQITISFVKDAYYAVSMPVGKGYTVTDIKGGQEADGNIYTVKHGGSLRFRVETDAGYDEESLAVTANGKTLTAKGGVYTIRDVKEDVAVRISIDKESGKLEKFSLYDKQTKAAVSGKAIGTPWLSAYKLSKSSAAYKKLLARADGLSVLGAYGLHVGGADVEGRLTVTFAVSKEYNGEKINVYRLRGDGKVEVHTAAVKSGKVTVHVNAVSEFLLAGPTEGSVILPPKTGDASHAQLPALMMAGALITAALCISVRKKETV